MPEHDEPFNEAVSDVANALQSAAIVADQLGATAVQQARDAATLRRAIARAVEATHRLRRGPDDPTDPRRV